MKNVLILVAAIAAGGCSKTRGPNTTSAEDKLLFDWAQPLASGDREAAMKFWDLEVRQRLELWDKQLKPLNDPQKQADILAAALPRIGDAAALQTVGREAWDEVKDGPWHEELADGKCTTAPPDKDDIGRGVLPKERKEMPQELGMWVFETRTQVHWAPAFRVRCPSGESFWVQMAQRKRTDASSEAPLKIVRVAK
jgi:hypothetical protein